MIRAAILLREPSVPGQDQFQPLDHGPIRCPDLLGTRKNITGPNSTPSSQNDPFRGGLDHTSELAVLLVPRRSAPRAPQEWSRHPGMDALGGRPPAALGSPVRCEGRTSGAPHRSVEGMLSPPELDHGASCPQGPSAGLRAEALHPEGLAGGVCGQPWRQHCKVASYCQCLVTFRMRGRVNDRIVTYFGVMVMTCVSTSIRAHPAASKGRRREAQGMQQVATFLCRVAAFPH